MVGEDFLGEVQMLLGNHLAQHLGEFLAGHARVHALVLVGDDDVHPVWMVTDVGVDPVQFDLELFGGEPHRAQHTEAPGFADGDHDIAAVGEREDGELDPELVAKCGVHERLLRCGRLKRVLFRPA